MLGCTINRIQQWQKSSIPAILLIIPDTLLGNFCCSNTADITKYPESTLKSLKQLQLNITSKSTCCSQIALRISQFQIYSQCNYSVAHSGPQIAQVCRGGKITAEYFYQKMVNCFSYPLSSRMPGGATSPPAPPAVYGPESLFY